MHPTLLAGIMYTCAWALWWGNLRKKRSNSRPHFYRKRSSCWTSACSPFWTSQWKGEDQKLTAFWTVSALLAVSSWIRRHVGHHANILLFFFTNMYCYFDSQPRPRVDNVLDSQCSIGSCFVDSQARGPSSPVSPAKRAAREPSKCTCLHAIHLPDWLPWRIYPLRHTHHITHAHTHNLLQPKCFIWLRLCYKPWKKPLLWHARAKVAASTQNWAQCCPAHLQVLRSWLRIYTATIEWDIPFV